MYIEKEEFKIGDTVVCIKSDTSNPGITEGSLYTILKLDSVPHDELGIIVENDYGDRQFYYAHRFIKFYQIEKETEMALTSTMNAEQIRDEILRIDARIEEAKKDIENAEKERNSLVENLREKGFEIVNQPKVLPLLDNPFLEINAEYVINEKNSSTWLEQGTRVICVDIDLSSRRLDAKVEDSEGNDDWVNSECLTKI